MWRLLAWLAAGCATRYRIVELAEPPRVVEARVDDEARAAGYSVTRAGDTRTYRKEGKTAEGTPTTQELRMRAVPRDAGTRVILERNWTRPDVLGDVLRDAPSTEATDYASPERDLYPRIADGFHVAPYFTYAAGDSPGDRGVDHRYYFGGFVALAVGTWGEGAAFVPRHRRRLWLGLGGEAALSVGDEPTWRGYAAVQFSHGDVRSLDGRHEIQSSPAYSYQLAFSMLRWEGTRRSELTLVAPMAAMGLVARVGWDWADDRAVAWSLGIRIPLPLSFGIPTGTDRLPSIPIVPIPAGGG